MANPLHASARPSRLPPAAQWLIALLLGLSFFTGVFIWWGQTLRDRDSAAPVWLHACTVAHGTLNPFLTGLFGYLVCHHIRIGWELRANLATGFAMELVFLVQILTGVGIYYAGAQAWHDGFVWTHRVCGLLFPLAIALHWAAARRYVRRL